MDLTITPVYAHDAIVVHLGGKIDTGGAAALRQHFLHLFAAGHFRLVADLRHVTFLDAAGINVLLDTHAQAQSRRGFLRLAGAPAVLKIFKLDALRNEFAFYNCIEAAVTEAVQPEPEGLWADGDPPWWPLTTSHRGADTGPLPPGLPAHPPWSLNEGTPHAEPPTTAPDPTTTDGVTQVDTSSEALIHRAAKLGPAGLAGQGADSIAALAWATLPPAEGLDHTGDVCDVLAELASLAELLPQISEQLCAFLHAHVAQPGVRAFPGFPHAGDPRAAVREASACLAEVEDLATRLRHAWRRAQHAITGLVIDPRPSGEVARHG